MRKTLNKIIAWSGLSLIFVFVFFLVIGLFTSNEKALMIGIIGLAFVTIVMWLFVKFVKRFEEKEKLIQNELKDLNEIASKRTKNINS